MPPPAGRKRPFVGPLRRWPLPNSTPCAGAGNYFYQFWEPNIQYQKLPSGVLVWWEDYLAADGSSRRRVTLYRPKGKVCAHSDKAAAPPTTAPPVTPAPTTAGTTGGRVALEMRDGIGTYRLLDDGTIIIDFFDGDRWEYVPDGEGTYTWYTKKSQSQYDRTELDEIPVPDEMQSAAVDLQPEME